MNLSLIHSQFGIAVVLSTLWLTGCTSNLVTRLKPAESVDVPKVMPLDKSAKVPMEYALRRTKFDVLLKFDVIKTVTVKRETGGEDTLVKGSEKYELSPNPGEDSLTCAVDYINDPLLTFEIDTDARNRAFIGKNESFSYDESGRLSAISASYSGKAAETTKFVISAAFSLAKLGATMGLFSADDEPTREVREVLDRKVVLRKTIFPESLVGKNGNYTVSLDEDIRKAVDSFQTSQRIAPIVWKHGVLFNISTSNNRIASSKAVRQQIEKVAKEGSLIGLPVRAMAPIATISFVIVSEDGSDSVKVAEQAVGLPELTNITFLPFPANPWRSTLTTNLELYSNGTIKKFGRESSSAAADGAGLASSVAETLSTEIPAVSKIIADRKKAEADLRLKTMTQQSVVKQKGATLHAKIEAVKAMIDGPERLQAKAEIEADKAQIEIEREKLNYLRQGVDVGG